MNGKSFPRMQIPFQICQDINPCLTAGELRRPSRDVPWLKRITQDIRVDCSKIFMDYKKSGNQNAEDEYLEFSKFFEGDEIIMYAFVRLYGDLLLVNRLGKQLPENIGRDTGVLGETSQRPPLVPRNSHKRSSSPSVSGSSSDDPTKRIVHTHVMQSSSSESNEGDLRAQRMEFELSLSLVQRREAGSLLITKEMEEQALEAIVRLQQLMAARNKAAATPARVPAVTLGARTLDLGTPDSLNTTYI